ncbi:S1 RNA-binding domain-containing protein [Thiomicrorhabdus sediminis]|uniref:GntR family transcriptional regulator n=1 Tax=Thiomicrorhabdus sediminis TaxID=2580412 RepID=A0A4V1HI12_9GAMM|nr:S1-like domain-containing RNA-binding protein [Thiomicrorhabdus sediminis]QCU90913.1 GntR family transcriptional regulator [Thiomicrorhabdus sediminis]
MAHIGYLNTLEVVKEVEFGLYLDGANLGEILLPKRYVPAGVAIGDEIEVFVYLDSQDRLVATTDKPLAQLGQVACLKVVDVNRTGAFMNWGMPKDLFVPYAEQRVPMEQGRRYCVYLYLDKSGRIAASSKLSLYLSEQSKNFKAGQAVTLLIVSQSKMGFTAVIDGTHLGLLHHSDLIQPLKIGQQLNGYIKGIRDDRKINLTLQPSGAQAHDDLADKIIADLRANDGVSSLTDASSPEEIFQRFRVSKARYKKALGRLYKAKKIDLSKQSVRLLES